jgi:hypothetical protein
MRVRKALDLDDLFPKSLGDGLGFRMDLEFFVDVPEMERNCVDTDVELIPGSFITMALDEHFEQFFFLRRQMVGGIFRRCEVLK